jgi:hypothetical protein
MKKTSSLPVAMAIIGILLIFSLGYSLNSIVGADFSDSDWQLTVNGLVDHFLNLTLADIVAKPQTTEYAPLICAGPPSFTVTEGDWTGVKLWLLLEEAGVLPETVKVAFHAQDGYTTDLAVDTALRDDVILAYEKDGAPLSETLRLVVPGCWGYKWIAKVTGIELVNYNFLGMYESLGYSDEGYITGETTPQLPLPPPSPNLPQSSTTPPLPSPSPSPSLSPSPSPNPSNSSSPAPSQTQSPQSTPFFPMDSIYATAAVVIIAVIAITVMLKKRTK